MWPFVTSINPLLFDYHKHRIVTITFFFDPLFYKSYTLFSHFSPYFLHLFTHLLSSLSTILSFFYCHERRLQQLNEQIAIQL